MAITGPLSHVDISVGYPARSIPFYEALLTALGFKRWRVDMPEWQGERPSRASWMLRLPGGGYFGVETRPARATARDRRYDRYEPGPHHLAFHAESPTKVDEIYEKMRAVGAEILDPPRDYSDDPHYAPGYYAVFFADPDGVKLEVVFEPRTNP